MPRDSNSEFPDWTGRERRAAADSFRARINRLKSLLARPMVIRRTGLIVRVELVDRRASNRRLAVTVEQMSTELGSRLFNHSHGSAVHVMRHLTMVHDLLGQSGWDGVQALPSKLLGRALAQAEMLHADDPTAAMKVLVERISAMRVAAEIREEKGLASEARQRVEDRVERVASVDRNERVERVDVSDSTHEEFQGIERSWIGTFPLTESDSRTAGSRPMQLV